MSVFRRMFGMGAPDDNLRIVITRHGERADFALGKQWYRRLQRTRGQDSRVSPLPARTNSHEWNFDSPLTIEGENQSSSVGKKLLSFGYPIDYCYSSPAFRSIQTATKILESQGRKHVPINIEPGLFECPAWYRGKPLKFFHPQELARDRRFHINPHYSPIYDSVDPQEEERKYYKRSRRLIRKIISNHKNTGGTVLLSGHGGSIEAVTQGLRGLLQPVIRVPHNQFDDIYKDYIRRLLSNTSIECLLRRSCFCTDLKGFSIESSRELYSIDKTDRIAFH